VGVESKELNSAKRPLSGLLYPPRVVMRIENLVEWWLARETEVLGGNLSRCHFVHHKSHLTWRGANLGRRGGKPATNCLSYGTANISCKLSFPIVGFKISSLLSLASKSFFFSAFSYTRSTWKTDWINVLVLHRSCPLYHELHSKLGHVEQKQQASKFLEFYMASYQ
jgi:hypothetical protein